MTRCFSWTLVVLLLALAVLCRGEAVARQPGSGPGLAAPAANDGTREPRLRALKVVQADPENLGVVSMGWPARRRLVFENALDVPVEVSIEEMSSGCLDASFDPTCVAPAERTTLLMRVEVAAPGSMQVQGVTIRARWPLPTGQTGEETADCLLRYTPETRFVLRPESAAAAVARGGRGSFDVFIRELESPDEPPDLEPIAPERAGWTLTKVQDPSIPAGVLRFRAEGPVGDEPYEDFTVRWRVRGEPGPAAELPIRLRSLPPWRSLPAGVVLHGGRYERTQRLTLTPRGQGPEPASLRVRGGGNAVRASLDQRAVTVYFTPNDSTPEIASAWIDVLDGEGRVLVDIPVAWFLDAGR